jgi:hypothetical protein
MMHVSVEKDVRMGIQMMKYIVNHYKNFTLVIPPFMITLMWSINSYIIEINVLLILSSMTDIISVIMKYVSLAAISMIPTFYFNSITHHKLLKCAKMEIKITNFRADKPLQNAPWHVKVMRFVNKIFRTYYISVHYYFTPFLSIMLMYPFMISYQNVHIQNVHT